MNLTKTVAPVMAIACLACSASSSLAAYMDVRVDINEYAGTVTGWNTLTEPNGSIPVLLDYITGLDSGAALTTPDAFNESSVNAAAAWSNPAATWVDNDALRDYYTLSAGNATGSLTLSGLDPGSTYRIELLSVRNDNRALDTAFQVNSLYGLVVDSAGNTTATNTSAFNAQDDGYALKQFMLWESVTPNGSGEITVSATSPGDFSFFNGLRISATPEPSSLILLAGGGLALLGGWAVRVRRRRRGR